MLEELRARVCAVNQMLSSAGLAPQTWGNASGIDRTAGLVAIKPSGVPYAALQPADIVLVDLTGEVVEGGLTPSVDLPTHLELYRAFPCIGGVVHTHSHYAVCWAQARQAIPCLGTTHADYFHGEIPLTRQLTELEIGDYELNTGRVIAETFSDRPAMHCPGVLVPGHAPFTWGASVEKALESAVVLEEIARMAFNTRTLAPDAPKLEAHVLAKHHERKHGPSAYYGQR